MWKLITDQTWFLIAPLNSPQLKSMRRKFIVKILLQGFYSSIIRNVCNYKLIVFLHYSMPYYTDNLQLQLNSLYKSLTHIWRCMQVLQYNIGEHHMIFPRITCAVNKKIIYLWYVIVLYPDLYMHKNNYDCKCQWIFYCWHFRLL